MITFILQTWKPRPRGKVRARSAWSLQVPAGLAWPEMPRGGQLSTWFLRLGSPTPALREPWWLGVARASVGMNHGEPLQALAWPDCQVWGGNGLAPGWEPCRRESTTSLVQASTANMDPRPSAASTNLWRRLEEKQVQADKTAEVSPEPRTLPTKAGSSRGASPSFAE